MESIPRRVREKLGYYVYLYVDPRDGLPFYVGKGQGNRLLAHLDDRTETEKVRRITELGKLGLKPIIEILKYGLSEHEAFLIESASIELLGLEQLTNRVKGHHAEQQGRGRLEDIVQELDAEEVEISHAVILININRLYRYGMPQIQLYDATRSSWKVGPRRANAEYAFCVYGGIVRAVYRVAAWVPAGSTMMSPTYDHREHEAPDRFEFVGKLAAEDIRRKYVGKSIKQYFAKGAQNPIKYINC
ncbi:MAG: hypothetical protein HON53_13715 [Planctomycetaceae bacterium]|jgi:uncharacterized protein|nr:hypothetical protein [Planctomycetaceae bacterium]MBT6157359.1 hypothetical protein [Planctomycetaceae bacterium]MBT6483858.1 hypothetical protein [Planctomycetaceae bacterium]